MVNLCWLCERMPCNFFGYHKCNPVPDLPAWQRPQDWFFKDSVDPWYPNTFDAPCQFPMEDPTGKELDEKDKPPCEWWFAIQPIANAQASSVQKALQPLLSIPLLQQGFLCEPFTAIDAQGKMNSGIDPNWGNTPWILCQDPKANKMGKQVYTRTFAADTALDPGNDWGVVVYSWLNIQAQTDPGEGLRFEWLSMSIFLRHVNDARSVFAVCYNNVDCRKNVPSIPTTDGAWAPRAILHYDKDWKSYHLMPYDRWIPDEYNHRYDLIDVETFTDVQKKAFASPLWSLNNHLTDASFKYDIGTTWDTYVVPGVFGPDVPYPH